MVRTHRLAGFAVCLLVDVGEDLRQIVFIYSYELKNIDMGKSSPITVIS